MESVTCKKCGKILEGYTKKHIETMLKQHMIKHENEAKEKGKKDEKK